MSEWTPPPQPSRRRRYIAIGAGVAAVVAIAAIVVSLRNDDPKPAVSATTPQQTISEIGSPAQVVSTLGAADGSSSTPAAPLPTAATPSSTATIASDVNRAFDSSGTFTCAAPGTWQPFPDLDIAFRVGEPAAGTSCPADVIDLPYGYCSTAPCSEIPADFVVRQLPDVPPDQFFVIVALPLGDDGSSGVSRFFCVVNGVRQPVVVLPSDTAPEAACAAEPIGPTPGTADIPSFPPGSGDIPLPPPPVSADIAASG